MDNVREEYFNWIKGRVIKKKFKDAPMQFNKLLERLFEVEFTYTIPLDYNRYDDGLRVRELWEYEEKLPKHTCEQITGPCMMLEMMFGLAVRAEDHLGNPRFGDRTGQWFWYMVRSLELNRYECTDDGFDIEYVDSCINRFLNKEYMSNGRGGLFLVYDCEEDFREIEIWVQLQRFLMVQSDMDEALEEAIDRIAANDPNWREELLLS